MSRRDTGVRSRSLVVGRVHVDHGGREQVLVWVDAQAANCRSDAAPPFRMPGRHSRISNKYHAIVSITSTARRIIA